MGNSIQKNGGRKSREMKIYDISQEVFGCCVFPGDPAPERKILRSMQEGAVCNLTAISMCAHNGTHVDAPNHFIADGKTVDQMGVKPFIGWAYVAEHNGKILAEDAEKMLINAENCDPRAARRLLVKGKAELTAEAARFLAEKRILLYGNESQTVGPEEAPMEVHRILLGAGLVLVEGIRLSAVPEGVYLLHAAPLNLGGAEGAPCRATLLKL